MLLPVCYYDNNGNLIKKQAKANFPNSDVTNFSYSSENQLLGFKIYANGSNTNPIKEVFYTYDASGRRLQKKVIDNVDSSKSFTRRYVYDGDEILFEYDGENNLLAHYTHSNLRTDDVLAVDITSEGVNAGLAQSSGSFQYLKDHQGSVTDVTDNSGNKLMHLVYSAFGVLIGIQDANAQEIAFTSAPLRTSYSYTGREYDSESGYYYYRARYYDANIGRFLQKDPDPGDLGMPSTLLNSYSGFGNDGANMTDPYGNFIFLALFIYTAATASTASIGAAALTGALLGAFGYAASFEVANGFSPLAAFQAAIKDPGAFFKGLGLSALLGAVGGAIGQFVGSTINGILKLGTEGTKLASYIGKGIAEASFASFNSFGATLGQNIAHGDPDPFGNALGAAALAAPFAFTGGMIAKGLQGNKATLRFIIMKREGMLFIGTSYIPYYENRK